jgi:hypothetical protein
MRSVEGISGLQAGEEVNTATAIAAHSYSSGGSIRPGVLPGCVDQGLLLQTLIT